jgi:hypothetical protein
MRTIVLAALLAVACDEPGGGGGVARPDAGADASTDECPEHAHDFGDGEGCVCLSINMHWLNGECVCNDPEALEWEAQCLVPWADDDGDSLTNEEEVEGCTLWYEADTDKDGDFDNEDPSPCGAG